MSEFYGIFRGSIYDVVDPENRGRLRILVPQVFGVEPSGWAEPTQPVADSYAPEPGNKVWVFFEGGDINRPVYVSADEVVADKIRANAITAREIAANAITTRELAADAITVDLLTANEAFITALKATDFSAVKIRGPFMTTRAQVVDPVTGLPTEALTGSGQTFSPDGFFTYGEKDASGNEVERIAMPTVGTQIWRGDAYIDYLTVKEFVALASSALAEGAVFTMNTGVTPPGNPPSVDFDYATQKFTDDGLWGDRQGWSTDGIYWYTTRQTSSGGRYIEKWSSSGTRISSVSQGGAGKAGDLSGGCVVGGGFLWSLYQFTSAGGTKYWYVDKLSLTTLGYLDSYAWNHADGTRAPAIGWDSTPGATSPLLIAQSKASDNKVTIRRYPLPTSTSTTIASLNQSSSVIHDDGVYAFNLSTLLCGSFDFTGPRYVFSGAGTQYFRVVSTTTGDFPTGDPDTWQSGMTDKVGCDWDGTKFRAMDKTGLMWTYEPAASMRYTTTADQWLLAYQRYYKSDGSPNPVATAWSPVTRISQRKRARVVVSGAPLPSITGANAPNQVQFSMKRETAVGGPWLQGSVTPPAGGVPKLTLTALSTVVDPLTVGSFGTGLASKIQAVQGGFYVNAQSNGSVGTGTFRDSVDARIAAKRSAGFLSVSIDAGGFGLIPHGLGVVPSSVSLVQADFFGTAYIPQWDRAGSTSTNIAFRVKDHTGAIVASVTRGFGWQAYV